MLKGFSVEEQSRLLDYIKNDYETFYQEFLLDSQYFEEDLTMR